MSKLTDHLKCSPLACMAVIFTVVGLLFGSIKADVVEIRQVVYKLLESKTQKTALAAPKTRDLAFKATSPFTNN